MASQERKTTGSPPENHMRTSEQRSADLVEMLLPEKLSEAGFQSYVELANNAPKCKLEFIAGGVVNPDLQYGRFQDLGRMDQGILRLYQAIETVRLIEPDVEKAEIIATSLEFRAAEMEYIKLLARIDFVMHEGGTKEDAKELFEQTRLLGEQLYGRPEDSLRDSAYAEVWRQLDDKNLPPAAKVIYDELRNGFNWNDRHIDGLPRPENAEILPDFEHPSLAWAGEIVLANNTDIDALIEEFWQEKVAEFGEDYTADPNDITEAFNSVLSLMDPDRTSGVSVIIDPEASALSWETPLMAVKIGGRRPPIDSKEELLQKVIHELKVHGGRAIEGIKSGLPVLGTGLYTNTERPDYLTFEEGFATTIEGAIAGSKPSWSGTNMGHYINIAQAEDGKDFREVFETSWRYRLLLSLEGDQDVTDELIEKEKSSAYSACIRIFRGTPVKSKEVYPDIQPLTFNKDLAYLLGRVIAMEELDRLYGDKNEAGLMRLLNAKYDPTIPEQAAIVDKYQVIQ